MLHSSFEVATLSSVGFDWRLPKDLVLKRQDRRPSARYGRLGRQEVLKIQPWRKIRRTDGVDVDA